MTGFRSLITRTTKEIYSNNKNLFIWKPLRFLARSYRASSLKRLSLNAIMFIRIMKLQISFKKVLKIKCFECNPVAKTEVHSLVCHRHLNMYITAIKSFLRFYSNLAVILHDDGSLTNNDKALLERHVKGIHIISKEVADEKIFTMLQKYPNCRKYRKDHFVSLQLFDFSLLSNTGKIIAMDSDVLFFQYPTRLIDWIQNNTKEIIHYVEESPARQKEFLLSFGNTNYTPNFSFGFACFYKEIFDLKTIEFVLSKINVVNWVLNQNIFAILMNNMAHEYPRNELDKNTYQDRKDFKDGKIFRHYQSSVLFNAPSHSYLLNTYREDTKNVLSEI